MKRVWAIIWKDVRLRFSSRSEILFFLILPVLFTFILAGAFAGGSGDSRIVVAVVDEAEDALASELIAVLSVSTAVRPEVLSRAEAEQRIEARSASALLLIPAGFERAWQRGDVTELELRTLPNDTNALAAERAIWAAVRAVGRAVAVARVSLAAAEQAAPFTSAAERQAYLAEGVRLASAEFAAAPERVRQVQALAAEEGDPFDMRAQASAGQLITWVFIPLLGTSALFAYERARGTLRRLLTTPVRKPTFLLGTIFGQLGLGLVQMIVLIGFGQYALGVQWGQSPGALALIIVTFGLAAVALGTTLGTFVKTEGQASNLSIMLGMVMALLGGCWYPMELFPEVARTAARVLPTTWAMQGLSDIVMRGHGWVEVWPEAAVLVGFASAFFVAGIWRFKFE